MNSSPAHELYAKAMTTSAWNELVTWTETVTVLDAVMALEMDPDKITAAIVRAVAVAMGAQRPNAPRSVHSHEFTIDIDVRLKP